MFLSWSRSRERGWSTTVKVYPSFRNWSSSWFCSSLRGFCSGPTNFCTHQSHRRLSTAESSPWGSSNRHRQAVPSCSSLSLWSAGTHRTGTGRRRSALCSLGMDQNKHGETLYKMCASLWNVHPSPAHLWAPASLHAAGFCEKWDSPEWRPSRDASESAGEAVTQIHIGRKHFHTLWH